VCSILLLAFGVGSVIGESNYILYPIARAQLEEEVEELREDYERIAG
jgi:hypothetical protein